FTVVPLESPVPFIVSLYPNFVQAGSSAFRLAVNGSFFNPSSVVLLNGTPRSTYFYTPGQLPVQISASDIAAAGYAQIAVSNPGPSGGLSGVAEFQILYQPRIVNQATKDMV